MASTYSALKIELIGTGEQDGTWGTTTNTNLGTALEQAIVGKADITMSSTTITLTLTDTNALQDARAIYLNLTGSPGGAADLEVPAIQKPYIVKNGADAVVTVKVTGQTGVAVPVGKTVLVYNNGTDVTTAVDHIPSLTLGAALPVASGGTGATTLTSNNVILGNGTSAVQFVAPGTTGNILTSNGTTWTSAVPAPGGIEYVVKTSNYTTQDKEGVLADTSGGSFTVTLPATPATGAQVVVADPTGDWGTNNLTIGRNGSTIADVAQDLVCDISGVSVQLVYDGTTWAVYAQVGGNGGNINLASQVTGTLPVANGGTGATTFAANNVLLGNGTSAFQVVAPGTAGNVLTSNGTTWTSVAAAGGLVANPVTVAATKAFPPSATTLNTGVAIDMSSTVDLVINASTGSANSAGVQAFVYDSNTDTFGSLTSIRSGTFAIVGAFKIDSTNALIVSCDNTTAMEAVVVTLSGTTISVGTPATVTLASNRFASYNSTSIIAGSTYICGFGTASNGAGLVGFTVSGTTVTAGTPVYFSSGGSAIALPSLIDSSNIIVTGTGSTNTRLDVATYSVSGATLTLINTANGTSARCVSGKISKPILLASGNYAAFTSTSGADQYGYIISLDGSNNPSLTEVSLGSMYRANGTEASADYVVSGSSVLTRNTNFQSFNVLTDSSGTATAGTLTTTGTGTDTTAGAIPFNGAFYGNSASGNNHAKITIDTGEVKIDFVDGGVFDYGGVSSTVSASGGFSITMLGDASKVVNVDYASAGTSQTPRIVQPILNSDDTVDLAQGVLALNNFISYVHYDDVAKLNSKAWFKQSTSNNFCKLELT